MVITEKKGDGVGEWGEIVEGKRGTNGDEKRGDFGW